MTQGYRPARDLGERFWEKVDREGECWLWKAAIGGSGYGIFGIGSRTTGTRTTVAAHRVAYFLTTGVMSDTTHHVHHICRNPLCVRPSHLKLVTAIEHVYEHDGVTARNGMMTHCRKCDRVLGGDNLIVEGASRARRCRHCRYAYVNEYRRRRRLLAKSRNAGVQA
jgi:hypothetical protein